MPTVTRPATTEYAPYYGKYVDQIPDDVDILDLLERQLGDTVHLLSGVSEERAAHRYAEGKWTLKEVVGHMVDTERVFAYRALCFARGDAGPFPSFEQDGYVANGGFAARALRDLVGEFVHVRRANVHMLRGLPPEAWERAGVASNVRFTVRAMPFILAGHERHHVQILKEKYL
jgi:hypothetical protein